MNIKLVLSACLLLIAGFAGGFLTARHFQEENSNSADQVEAPESVLVAFGEAPGREDHSTHRSKRERNEGLPESPGHGKADLDALLTLTEDRERHEALEGQTPDQLAQLLDELQASGVESPEARSLKKVLYHRLADRRPGEALAKVLKESDGRLQDEIIHHAFSEMAERDLGQATAAFLQLQTARQREHAVEAMAHHVQLDDMETMADFFMREVPHGPSGALFRRWAERDPESPALHEKAMARGLDALRAVAEGWASSDPEAALAWARGVDAERPGGHVLTAALETMVHQNPSEAAAHVAALPQSPRRSHLAGALARMWAKEDFQAALAWSESLDGRSQVEATREIVQEWARRDPRAASDYAVNLPASEQRREVFAGIAREWAGENVAGALEWARSLDPMEAVPALHGILERVGRTDPSAAAQLVSELGETPGSLGLTDEAYGNLARDVAGGWSDFDPRAAADWAESIPGEAEVRRRAVQEVAERWMRQDSLAASEWISGMPAGETRDRATQALVNHVARIDPEAAVQWALSVSDSGQQTDMLHRVFEQWVDRDPGAAEATLNAAPISPQQRQALNGIFGENR